MSTGSGLPSKAPWAAAALALALAAGCAGLRLPDPPVAEIAQQRQQRADSAAQEFQTKRDFAELQAALAARNQGDARACEEGLRRILERNPNHRDARLIMAELCQAGGRTQEALKHLDQAMLAHPNDAQVQFRAATLLEGAGKSGAALAYYERAVNLEPGNGVYLAGYEAALRTAERTGTPAGKPAGLGDNSLRASLGQPLLAPDPSAPISLPGSPPVGPGPNILRTSAPADIAAAHPAASTPAVHTEPAGRVDAVGSAGSSESDEVRAMLGEGLSALANGSGAAALAHFQRAASICPDNPQIPIAAAMAALRHNRPDLTVELLLPAERRFSGSAQLYRALGLAYYRLGDYHSSQVALRQALSLDKSSALSYFLMGCTLSKLGQTESAEVHLRQARTIDPRYTVER